ncbi:berberine bridge enzyme-like 14 [Benincasa hispida]|uniref:berberine bridge enzyme-like 14 n=1 Tax=Benincasa hispida TaxID=102211 RepID=UPI0019027220|nr:berberine bridge enzyme-like 14 [Benincasa hispida]
MWSSSSSSSTLTFFSLILIFSPLISSVSVQQSFLQCLTTTSQPQFPISDAIFTTNNSFFLPVLNSYIRNLRFQTPTTPKPLVIVTAKHQSHVQSTVVCAKRVGLQIRIRSGGHDYEGFSYVSQQPFIILDLFNLRAIRVNIAKGTARVQAGATLGELYYAIANKSNLHGFPGGVCPTVATGGHFSGGGYGNLIRKFGLTIDNILDAQIVNADGKILNRQTMGEDLFWAIRGGGGGSFGVILSWKINLVPVPSTVTVFDVERKIEDGATDVVWQWQNVMDKLDENLFIRLMLHSSKGKNGQKTGKATLVALFLGPVEKLMQIINQNIPSLKLQRQECFEMSWIQSVLFWANFPNGTAPEALLSRKISSTPFLKRKSDYVREPISREGIEAIWKAIMEVEEVGLTWNPYGGKMSQISETETPFPHRAGVKFKIQYSSNWKEGGDQEAQEEMELARRLYEAMTPYVTKNPREAFLNYRDIDVGISSHWSLEEGRVYGEKYFKGNFERLVNVKTEVNPQNFFRNEQSIPTRRSSLLVNEQR